MTAARKEDVDGAPRNDLRAVFVEHYGFVWRSARRLGAPPAQVDDITQDVFLAVHRAKTTFEGRSSLKTWLFGITVNTVKAWQRREGRHRRRTDALGREPPPRTVDLADRYVANDKLDRILARLNEVQRTTFILVELEDVAPREVATAFGVSVNTVHSRLRLARTRLQREVVRMRAQERSQR